MVVNTIDSIAMRDPGGPPKQTGKPAADKEAPPAQTEEVIAGKDEALVEGKGSEANRAEISAKAIDLGGKSISFNVNKDLNQVVAEITDNDTGEVIREVPSKELQDIAERLQKAAGRLLDRII